MYEFTSSLSSLFCCASFRRNRADDDAPSDLRTFQPPTSTLSLPLRYNTVPHRSSDDQIEETRALHHIFSSSSSVRGYQTAATTPAYVPTSRPSLDLDFKFGESSTPPKPEGRIEKMGKYIRHKLSESGLSKGSSRHSNQETQDNVSKARGDSRAGTNGLAATSQSSAGLSEVLTSANASRGGYDSDAKSINSPDLNSDAGSIQVGKGFVKHALEQFEALGQLPSASNSAYQAAVASPSTTHEKGHSSPFPETPKKTSFADALQIGKDESPRDLLRRLSAGIADGSIKMPDTPELRAARLPSIKEVDNDWRLFAPKRSSSLARQQGEVDEKQKQLGEMSPAVSEKNHHALSEETKRTSLISELDPALLDYLDRYSDRFSSDSFRHHSSDTKQALQIPADGQTVPARPEPGHTSPKPDTDRDSVHLFNMRISQRLASRSRVPMTSPTSSLHSSVRSLMLNGDPASQSNSTRPSRAPGPIMREHNRRPSDPQTRQLFEVALGSRDASRSWKTITAAASSNSYAGLQSTTNNASSCYLSEDDEKSNNRKTLRRSLNVNPHSLAIGGRSLSVSFSSGNRRPRHLSPADSGWSQQLSTNNLRSSEESWDSPTRLYQRGRSVSMPQKRTRKPHVSPTPNPKRLRQPTVDAENLSEISLDDILDRRNERMTEITTEDVAIRRDEQFSEIDHTMLPADGSMSRRSGEESHYHSVPGRSSGKQPSPDGKPAIKECATDIWGRAIRQVVGLDESLPSLRPAKRRSIDAAGSLFNTEANNRASIGSTRRSRSVGDLRGSFCGEGGSDLLQSVRISFPTALSEISTLPGHDSGIQRKTLEPKQRKKSILDLKRHFTSGPSTSSEIASTPFKELISIWSKFPSHTRAERNGSASIGNNVVAQDFVPGAGSVPDRKGKMKSMTVREPLWSSPAARARKHRKGILGKWKRIYRSSSSDLRKYAYNHGHRSSISLGDSLEYPELECLPGEGKFTVTDVERLYSKLEGPGEREPKTEHPAALKPRTRPEAIDWGKIYGECVGSMSALNIEADADVKSGMNLTDAADVKSMDMRDSTINFQEALGREQQKLKQQIIDQISMMDGAVAKEDTRSWEKRVSSATETTNDTIIASSIKTKDLKIPGSFG